MMRKAATGTVWLLAVAALYFFENNTGTRIVLACSLFLPLFLIIFRRLTERKGALFQEADQIQPQKAESITGDSEPGNVREYIPGDPIRAIHWKLTAKTDRLLIRQEEPVIEVRHEDLSVPGSEERSLNPRRKKALQLPVQATVFVLLGTLLLLLLIPDFRISAAALCNRLFDWSESVNTYVYARFPVPEGQGVLPAGILLFIAGAAWASLLIISGNWILTLVTVAFLAGFQIYFGVAFPAWINVILFAGLGLLLFPGAVGGRSMLYYPAFILMVSLMTLLVWPDVDPRTEAASERVRDTCSHVLQQVTGTVSETPSDGMETRHLNTQSLLSGEEASASNKTYRLVTVEEEQISIPHWINYLKIILLLFLAVALITLPFVPFAILNSRRKKAQEARKIFDSENVNEAVAAMFRHVAAWLKATHHDAGNRLFLEWTETVSAQFPKEYAARYARCVILFEEAAYSEHSLDEEARDEVRTLLDETENMLYEQADWKQRFRLKYVEGLCI